MTTCTSPPRKFHFGLTVADLDRAVEHYRVLLGAAPVVHSRDFAKFDVDDPPIVLSLAPGAAAPGGALNHVGFRVADSAALMQVEERLQSHGITTEREEGVACCYSRQTKFWVSDADRNLWEIYTVHEDLDYAGFGGEGSCGHLPHDRPEVACFVMYRGPLAKVKDDAGREFPRGQRVEVDGATWRMFRTPPFDEHFNCLSSSAGTVQLANVEFHPARQGAPL
jgi:catechol 2,3-dioxygenase-like lactoylglutathione lyase family enzyme